MKIDILTLFPEICRAPLSESIMKRAQKNGIVDLRIHNLRDWTKDKHHIVDDAPFGGGQGMVMKAEPIFAAVEEMRGENGEKTQIAKRKTKNILMSPAGHPFDQQIAAQLSQGNHSEIAAWRKKEALKRTRDNRPDLLGRGGSPEQPAADANTDHAGD